MNDGAYLSEGIKINVYIQHHQYMCSYITFEQISEAEPVTSILLKIGIARYAYDQKNVEPLKLTIIPMFTGRVQ